MDSSITIIAKYGSQIKKNELCFIKHCSDVYNQNSIAKSSSVDDWTTKWPIIASNIEFPV